MALLSAQYVLRIKRKHQLHRCLASGLHTGFAARLANTPRPELAPNQATPLEGGSGVVGFLARSVMIDKALRSDAHGGPTGGHGARNETSYRPNPLVPPSRRGRGALSPSSRVARIGEHAPLPSLFRGGKGSRWGRSEPVRTRRAVKPTVSPRSHEVSTRPETYPCGLGYPGSFIFRAILYGLSLLGVVSAEVNPHLLHCGVG